MSDPMLDEIWRVREELFRQHGGLDGYIKHVQKLERAHAERQEKTQPSGRRRRRTAAK